MPYNSSLLTGNNKVFSGSGTQNTEGHLTLDAAPLARPAGGVRGPAKAPAVARACELGPAREVSPELPQLDDVGLTQRRVDPVGGEEEEHPGLALVDRDLAAALGHGDREPHHSHVCQDAQGGTFGGAQEAPVGFQ